jgi:hypothetical protein
MSWLGNITPEKRATYDRSGDARRSDLGTYWRPYVQAESDFGLIPRE